MLLANYTSTTNLAREPDMVSESYQKLGLLAEIAKQVKEYRVSRFSGNTEDNKRVIYRADCKEATTVEAFVRKWIADKKRDGLKDNFQANSPIDFDWVPFAESALTAHFKALQELKEHKLKFDKRFIQKFRSRYPFDEKALDRFVIQQTVSESDDPVE